MRRALPPADIARPASPRRRDGTAWYPARYRDADAVALLTGLPAISAAMLDAAERGEQQAGARGQCGRDGWPTLAGSRYATVFGRPGRWRDHRKPPACPLPRPRWPERRPRQAPARAPAEQGRAPLIIGMKPT